MQLRISLHISSASIPLRDIRLTSSLPTHGALPLPSLFLKSHPFPLALLIRLSSQQLTEAQHAKRAHRASHSSRKHLISPMQYTGWRKRALGDEQRKAGRTEGSSASSTRAMRTTKEMWMERKRKLRPPSRRGMGTMGELASEIERGSLTRPSSWIWMAQRFWEEDTDERLVGLLDRVRWQELMV